MSLGAFSFPQAARGRQAAHSRHTSANAAHTLFLPAGEKSTENAKTPCFSPLVFDLVRQFALSAGANAPPLSRPLPAGYGGHFSVFRTVVGVAFPLANMGGTAVFPSHPARKVGAGVSSLPAKCGDSICLPVAAEMDVYAFFCFIVASGAVAKKNGRRIARYAAAGRFHAWFGGASVQSSMQASLSAPTEIYLILQSVARSI